MSALLLNQIRAIAGKTSSITVCGEKLDVDAIRAAGGDTYRLKRWPGPRLWSRRQFSRRVMALANRQGSSYVIGHGDLLRQDALFIHNLVEREAELLDDRMSSHAPAAIQFHRELFRRREFKVLIAPSELARKDLVRRYGLTPEKVCVAYPGFDPAKFNRDNRVRQRHRIRSELGLDNYFVVAFVTSGNFPLRGADILRDTLLELPMGIRDDLKVLVVGAIHNTRKLQADFAAVGLDKLLVIQAKISAVENYYHAADLLFHPARLETFGLVVLEAAACGTPVLTSRAVGAAELLSDAGTDAAEPNAEIFAARLKDLMLDPPALEILSAGQLADVQAKDWQAYHRQWQAILHRHGLALRH